MWHIFNCSFQCSIVQVLYFIFYPINQQTDIAYRIHIDTCVYTHILICLIGDRDFWCFQKNKENEKKGHTTVTF